MPSSTSGIEFESICCSSREMDTFSVSVDCCLISITYVEVRYLYLIVTVVHSSGKQGSNSRVPERSFNPNTYSMINWYIQPAEPVYHVQPPLPECSNTAYTSA